MTRDLVVLERDIDRLPEEPAPALLIDSSVGGIELPEAMQAAVIMMKVYQRLVGGPPEPGKIGGDVIADEMGACVGRIRLNAFLSHLLMELIYLFLKPWLLLDPRPYDRRPRHTLSNVVEVGLKQGPNLLR